MRTRRVACSTTKKTDNLRTPAANGLDVGGQHRAKLVALRSTVGGVPDGAWSSWSPA
jgi:hypothetical protein